MTIFNPKDREGRLSEQVHTNPIVTRSAYDFGKEPIKVHPAMPQQTVPFNGLLTNKILASLPGDDFARILPHLVPVILLAKEQLSKAGQSLEFIYFPETAVFSQLLLLEDGSSSGTGIIGNEGMVGFTSILEDHPPTYSVHVTVPGTAMKIRREVIRREFVRGPAMQEILHRYARWRLNDLAQRAVCNGRHTITERLCTWLLMIRDRCSGFQVPLTHEEIASYLGARRAGITGACNTLRQSEIIKYRRGQIVILDRQRLEQAACECYRAGLQA